MADPAELAAIAAASALPLNALWRPGITLDDLASAGVARVSTGGALYRHALYAAVDAAGAARESREPGESVAYAELQALLIRGSR